MKMDLYLVQEKENLYHAPLKSKIRTEEGISTLIKDKCEWFCGTRDAKHATSMTVYDVQCQDSTLKFLDVGKMDFVLLNHAQKNELAI